MRWNTVGYGKLAPWGGGGGGGGMCSLNVQKIQVKDVRLIIWFLYLDIFVSVIIEVTKTQTHNHLLFVVL